MRRIALIGLMLLCCVDTFAQTPSPSPSPAPPPAPAAREADVASVDAIIAAVYDVISGSAGQKRDWNRMRSLFAPGARLIPVSARPEGGFAPRVTDIDGYIARSEPFFEKTGFFEKEVGRKLEHFGHVAHALSKYEARHAPNDPTPFVSGTNSIQLVNDGTRWWVMTILWEADAPVPTLPKK